MSKIIALSIVKNEEKNFLKDWLINTSQICDLHIIVDNGSTDNTKEIIKEFPNTILFESDIDFKTNEHKLRGFAYECLKDYAKNNDWIFILDADEFIYLKDFKEKKEEILNLPEKYNLLGCKLCDIWNKDTLEYRIDGFWSGWLDRFFRYEEEQPFSYIYREGLHVSPLPNYIRDCLGRGLYQTNIRILHFPYSTEERRNIKYNFYKENIKTNNPIDIYHYKSIINEYITIPLEKYSNSKKLICSLIRNRGWMLPLFLKNFNPILKDDSFEYYFIINNSIDDSEGILREWVEKNNVKCTIEIYNFEDECLGNHQWGELQLNHMSIMRNKHLKFARENKFDYMFSIDSDLLFNYEIFKHLILSDKDIISPVFFASWSRDAIDKPRSPNVWIRGDYEINQDFIMSLKSHRHLRKVGGLGAFTCISKNAFNNESLSYDKIDNLPSFIKMEDRFFCIRARVLNYELWASNYYDLLHIDNIYMLNNILQGSKFIK